MIGVYKILNTVNGRFYIGSSKNIENRFKGHMKELKRRNHHSNKLQKDFDEFGESVFNLIVVELCDEKKLRAREQHYLHLLKPFEGENGYNVCQNSMGGNSGDKTVYIYDNDGNYIDTMFSVTSCRKKYNGDAFGNIKLNRKLLYNYVPTENGFVFLDNFKGNKICVEKKHRHQFNYFCVSDFKIKKRTEGDIFEKFLEGEIMTSLTYSYPITIGMERYYIFNDKNKSQLLNKIKNYSDRDIVLCAFDLKGNIIRGFTGKGQAENILGVKTSTINSNSKSNNRNKFTRKMYSVHGKYIFKHYKFNEIPSKINIITGETITYHDIVQMFS